MEIKTLRDLIDATGLFSRIVAPSLAARDCNALTVLFAKDTPLLRVSEPVDQSTSPKERTKERQTDRPESGEKRTFEDSGR